VIFPDANLLLYAEDTESVHHQAACAWWDACLSGTESVNLCWPVLNAYLRIATNPRIHERPLTIDEAMQRVQSWLDQPCVRIVGPTEVHWEIFQTQIQESSATGNLISDAHLAALAIEHASVLYSTDRDFARFPGLKWKNPLGSRGR
jgi:toxin-antitoxin system PIN domain toxin